MLIKMHFQKEQGEVNRETMSKQFRQYYEECSADSNKYHNFKVVRQKYFGAIKMLGLHTIAKISETFAKKRFLFKN